MEEACKEMQYEKSRYVTIFQFRKKYVSLSLSFTNKVLS